MADTSKTLEILVRLRDQASKGFRRLGSEIKKLPLNVANVKRSFRAIGTASTLMATRVRGAFATIRRSVFGLQGLIAGVGLALTARSFLGVASSFEQMEVKLEKLTKGKGLETLTKINEWALKMPVNTQTAIDTFAMMMAMGLDVMDTWEKKMTTLVDVSVIFGEHAMPRVARALGQMISLGKLSSEELNQMSEAGINARKYLTEAFGKTVQEIQKARIPITEVVDAIWEGLSRDFAGAAEQAQKAWQGLVVTAVSFVNEFQRRVMDAGIFKELKDIIFELNVEMEKWLENNDALIKQEVPKYVEKVKSAVKGLWEDTQKIYKFMTSLPSDIVGIAGYGIIGRILLGGPKGMLLGALFAVSYKMGEILTGMASDVKNELAELEAAAEELRDKIAVAKVPKVHFWQPAETDPKQLAALLQQLQLIEDKIIQVKVKARSLLGVKGPDLPSGLVLDPQPDVKEAKPPKPIKYTPFVPPEMYEKEMRTSMAFLVLLAQGVTQQLDATYDQNLITIEKYFSERKDLLKEQFNKEMFLLKELADKEEERAVKKEADVVKEKDPKARLKLEQEAFQIRQKLVDLEAEIATKREMYSQRGFALLEEERVALEANVQNKIAIQAKLDEIKQRALIDTDVGMDALFQKELADLQTRQQEELQQLRDMKAEEAQIKDAERDQSLEKDKLAADQKKRLLDAHLTNTKQALGFMADAFGDMYEATGKKSKKWAQAQKAMQIAMTVITTYEAATSAYASALKIPYIGLYLAPVMAAMAVAAGMAKVAAMRSQQLAAGGVVKGISPHPKADNIPIDATAGEFMQPVSTVQHYGKSVMEAMRRKAIPKEVFTGFDIGKFTPPKPSYAMASGGSVPSAKSADPSDKQPQQIVIANITDPREIDKWLHSPEGTDSYINWISSNAPMVRRILVGS